jgi:sporulation protein YlmC with PRC-barrel domain
MRIEKKMMTALLLAGLGAAASAQTPAQPQDPAKKPDPAVATTRSPLVIQKASKVLGGKVENPRGEDLGKIEDLVVDPSSGTIEYAVLSFGGFLGVGDKYFALPWNMIKTSDPVDSKKDYRFVLDVDKAKLEKAPGFPKSNWPDIYSPSWSQEIDKYYGSTRNSANRAVDQNEKFKIFKVSDLMGQNLTNANGDKLGDIKEIGIDVRSGHLAFFVMASGGFLGLGDKTFAIPWEALSVQRKGDKEVFLLATTKEKLEKAPQFKDDDWMKVSDPAWAGDLYRYYGNRPYWSATPVEAGSDKRPIESGGKKN